MYFIWIALKLLFFTNNKNAFDEGNNMIFRHFFMWRIVFFGSHFLTIAGDMQEKNMISGISRYKLDSWLKKMYQLIFSHISCYGNVLLRDKKGIEISSKYVWQSESSDSTHLSGQQIMIFTRG